MIQWLKRLVASLQRWLRRLSGVSADDGSEKATVESFDVIPEPQRSELVSTLQELVTHEAGLRDAYKDMDPDSHSAGHLALEFSQSAEDVLLKTKMFADNQGYAIHEAMGQQGLYAKNAAVFLCRRVLEGKPPEDAVGDLERFLSLDQARGEVVMPLSGVVVSHEIELAKGIRLLPLDLLPPDSRIRVNAEAVLDRWIQSKMHGLPPKPQKTALVADYVVKPLVTRIVDGEFGKATKQQLPSPVLEDIRLVLSLVGPSCPIRGTVSFEFRDRQVEKSLLAIGYSLPSSEFAPPWGHNDVELSGEEAKPLVSSFLALEDKFKSRMLLALARFTQAMNRSVYGDRCIDLAIALELILNDGVRVNAYQFAQRVALLVDAPLEEKKNVRGIIKNLYSIRNALVHKGEIDQVKRYSGRRAHEVVDAATIVIAQVLRTLLLKGSEPDWSEYELIGGTLGDK